MNQTAQGTKVYELFKKHLDDHKFKYEAYDDDHVLKMIVHGEDLPQPTVIRILDDRDIVQILSPLPCMMPEEKRVDAAVAVSVANYGLVVGNFDFDMRDGEIRFRVSMDFEGLELNDIAIKNLLSPVFVITDRYNDRFFMLGKGMITLEQFIEQENNG